jgi:hypothetical protein
MGSHMFQNSRGLLIWDHGQYQFELLRCLHHHVAGRHDGIGGQVLRQRNHRSTPASGQWWRVPLVGFPWVGSVLVTTTAPRNQVAW